MSRQEAPSPRSSLIGPAVAEQHTLTPMALLVAAVAAVGGLVFGYDIGGGGGSFVMPGFQRQFGWICADGSAIKARSAHRQTTSRRGAGASRAATGAARAAATPYGAILGRSRALARRNPSRPVRAPAAVSASHHRAQPRRMGVSR
jgi:hypothetical protein